MQQETSRILYKMTGVKWEGGEGTVDAGGIWTGNFRFKGLQRQRAVKNKQNRSPLSPKVALGSVVTPASLFIEEKTRR